MNQPARTDSHSEKSVEDKKHYDGELIIGTHEVYNDVEGKTDLTARQPVNIDEGYDPEFVRKTTRRIDLRLVPYLAAAYSISLIDRTNIALARGLGMGVDLGLNVADTNYYSIAVLMFFPTYIILELPSNLGMRRFGPAGWLSSAVLAWGVILIGMAFVKTWQQLTAARALIGVFEAALFPGAALLVSCWYPRRQTQKRLSFFFSLSILANGISAILAYGLAQLEGAGGLRGWRWIFLVEGLITVVIGFFGYFVILNFPEKTKMLNEKEREMILTRIERDRADSLMDSFTWAKFGKYARDWKLWVFSFMFFSSTCAGYALSYFLPRILAGMGFNASLASLLVAPPYVYSLIPAISLAFLTDKTGVRSVWIMFNAFCVVIGLALTGFLPFGNTAGRYAGVFLAAGGSNANVPLIIGWAQGSIRAQSCRAYTSALVVAFGGVGGIISALVFKNKEAPLYRTGMSFTIAVNALTMLCCVVLSLFFRYRNTRADKHGEILEGLASFRYQL